MTRVMVMAGGPGGVVTWLLRKPLVIHEQNSIAGMTNRLLAPLAQRVCAAFPGTFKRKDILHTGNPVRREIAELSAAVATTSTRPSIWHLTGSRHLDEARAAYERAGVSARIAPFIDDMAEAYTCADLVLCRAGALTVAELAAAGVGAVLVPYPHAVDDHQTHNAQYLVAAGAAVVVQQRDLTPAKLSELLVPFCSEGARTRLLAMAEAARRLAQTRAAALVAEQCLEVAHG